MEPALATAAERVPDGARWIHEIKFDGYRVQVQLANNDVTIFTRRGYDWTERFQKIAGDAWHVKAGSAITDGEVVVPSADGYHGFCGSAEEAQAPIDEDRAGCFRPALSEWSGFAPLASDGPQGRTQEDNCWLGYSIQQKLHGQRQGNLCACLQSWPGRCRLESRRQFVHIRALA
jgi:hypothetical protein